MQFTEFFSCGRYPVEKDGCRFEIPVGIDDIRVTEIGRKGQHVATDIAPVAGSDIGQGTHRKAVSKVMQAWPRDAWLAAQPDASGKVYKDRREGVRIDCTA